VLFIAELSVKLSHHRDQVCTSRLNGTFAGLPPVIVARIIVVVVVHVSFFFALN
jgi:hypothetical protein